MVEEKKENRYWNIPVPADLDDKVEEHVKKDSHVSKAEFIRDAARRLLEAGGKK